MIRAYYELTKPGIIYGNALAAVAGYLLAARGHVDGMRFIGTIVGIGLIIASACVFNNFIDRGVDAKMERTRNRALVRGDISVLNALIFAGALGIAGFGILSVASNLLTVSLGVIAFITYILIYGYAKRHSIHGTLVGGVAGALPPVAGYTAVSGRFDLGALLLFVIMTVWQMPHFYAIAHYRKKDYASAKIPVLPVVKGFKRTRREIVLYIIVFVLVSLAMTFYGYTGVTYLAIMTVLGGYWLYLALKGYHTSDERRWSRKVFFGSLIVLVGWCTMLSFNSFLP